MGNEHSGVPLSRRYIVNMIEAHADGPISGGMMLLTANKIAESVAFNAGFRFLNGYICTDKENEQNKC